MKIAVISDSHGSKEAINRIKQHLVDVDVLLHCGDGINDIDQLSEEFKGKIYGVVGNCDFDKEYPSERIVEVNGKRIFMCHGHMYNVKASYNNILYKGLEVGADIILFGHTHIGVINESDKVILMNPGSLALSYGNIPKSFGCIEIDENNIINAYLQRL